MKTFLHMKGLNSLSKGESCALRRAVEGVKKSGVASTMFRLCFDNVSTMPLLRLYYGSTTARKSLFSSAALRVAAMLCFLVTIGVGNVWGDTGTLVTSLSGISGGNTYYITAYSSSTYYTVPNTTISGQTFTCTAGSVSSSTLTPPTGAGEFVFTAVNNVDDAYYIYNTNLEKYLVATGSKTFGYVTSSSSDYGYWTFSDMGSGQLSGEFSVTHSSKTHYMRSYNGQVKCYDGTSNSGVYLFQKDASCAGTTLDEPDVTAVPSSGQVVLSWPAVANASSYTVTCKTTSGGSSAGSVGSVTGSDTKNCTVSSLTNGTSYTFSVKANGNGSSYCDGDATEVVMVAGASYIVTWSVNGATYKTTYVYGDGSTKPTFPTTPTSCDATSTAFYGWSTAEWSGAIDDISAKTIYKDASQMPAVTGAITYYAVFAQESSTSFVKITSANDIYIGQKIAIVSNKQDYILQTNFSGNTTATHPNSDDAKLTVSSSQIWTLEDIDEYGYYKLKNSTTQVGVNRTSGLTSGSTAVGNYSTVASWWRIRLTTDFSYTVDDCFYMYNWATNSYYNFLENSGSAWVSYYATGISNSNKVWYAMKLYQPKREKYRTNCCTALSSINGAVSWSNATTAVVSWDNIANVSSWTVKYKTGEGAYSTWAGEQTVYTKSTTNDSRKVTITGLTPCANYDFQIIATPADGYCDKDQTINDSQTHNWTVTSTGVTNVTPATSFPTTTCTGFSIASMTPADGYTLPTTITVINADHTWNSSTGALTISNVTGDVTVTIAGQVAANFTNGETVFIQADSKNSSAWKDDACVKAYFNTSGSGGSAVTTYWLFDATDTDAGKKLFAAVVPSAGLNQVQLQRFASNCSTWWNSNGDLTKASSSGVNTFRSYGSAENNVAWNGSSTSLYLYGSQNSWASSLGTFADQGSGVWTATLSNYAPDATSKDYKIKTSYNNGWIGNGNSNDNATLSGMKVGSTYNVTATLNVTTHALTMSKVFVKGTVSFDLQGHGSAIDALTNVTAGSKISAPSPAPTDAAYDFGGWYKEAGCTNAWNFASDEVDETMTLYAKWTLKTYAITYNAGANGTGTVAAGEKSHGVSFTLSSSTFSRDHYTQDGWSTSDGGDKAYELGGSYTTNAALTLYPHWVADNYTVSWSVNNSSYTTGVTASNNNADYNTTVSAPTAPADDALSCANKFMGWSTTPLGSATGQSAPGDLFTTTSPAITGNTTFYAVFATGSGSSTDWNLVTSASAALADGDRIIIANSSTAGDSYKALGYQKVDGSSNETNRDAETVTIASGPKISNPTLATLNTDQDYIYPLQLVANSTFFNIKDEVNDKYLTASGGTSSNKLTLSSAGTDNSTKFSISVDGDGVASVVANFTGRNTMRYNTSGLFSCYGSGQENIYIYRNDVSYSDYVTNCCSLAGATNVAVASVTGTSATLSWTAPSPTTGITKLQVRDASDDAVLVDNLLVSATGATVTGLTECDEYSFYVASVGASCYTASASVDAQPFSGAKTVNYNYHGGTGSPTSFTTDCDHQTITLPSASKTDYTFNGWYTAESGGDKVGDAGDTYAPLSSPVTVHAQWAETNYVLTQTVGSHINKGHTGTVIKSSLLASSGMDLTYTISDNSYALPKTVSISGGGQTWTLGTNYTWELSADKHSATLHIASGLTISANVTVEVQEKARYTVTWSEHGLLSYSYYAADDNVLDWGDIDDCGTKAFYGWTADAGFTTHATTPPTMISKGSTVSASATYYAIYADTEEPENPGYNKITSSSNIVDGGTYLIVAPDVDYNSGGWHYEQYVYTGDNGNSKGGCVSVTFADQEETNITSKPNTAQEVVLDLVSGQANQFTLNYGDSHYLKGSTSSNELTHSALNEQDALFYWKISATEGHVGCIAPITGGRYLQSNKNNSQTGVFACYGGTQADAYLYLKETTAYSNFAKTCTTYDISITTPSGGTVETSPAAGTGVAGAGQTVTVNVTPNDCKYLSALKYNDGSDHTISIASAPYTFTMPAADVTVTATFSTKEVESIEAITTSHRLLMQDASFVGEQIRVTYDNGETEELAWNDNGGVLTFSGYNMSTLGNQTVTVSYSGCGTASTTYVIEIVDGVPITFSDCGHTTTTKYNADATVNVEGTTGAYSCTGWEFVGWSATSVADNSTSFTPVTNFNASTARTLYAVYAHIRQNNTYQDLYKSADMVADLQEGARYVLAAWVHNSSNKSYGLTGILPTVKATYYLQGTNDNNSGFAYSEDYTDANSYIYYSTATLAANAHWQLRGDGTGYWQLYNQTAGKYLDLSGHASGYVAVSNTPVGKIVLSNINNTAGDNDSQILIKHSTCEDTKRLVWNRNSGDGYFNQYTSGSMYFLTKDESFTSNPPCAPRSVTFHGNGGQITRYGEDTPAGSTVVVTEDVRDEGIYLPTAEFADCNGKSWNFYGWIDHAVDVSRVPILTSELLRGGAENAAYDISEGDEFWAVYSNQGEAMEVRGTASISMSDLDTKGYSSDEHTFTKGTITFGYVNVGHQSDNGMQFSEDDGCMYNKTSLGRINSIQLGHFVNSTTIARVKVYVGHSADAVTTELTSDCRQDVGTGTSATYTYYPQDDYEYMKIVASGGYFILSSLQVNYGQGALIYATTPDCSTISLSGDIYVTSRQNLGIMAPIPLTVEARQLDANADVVITSNSSDVYFSTDRTPNFQKASKPMNSVTVHADENGELETTVYVHYKPSTTGTGAASDVTVYANLTPANPAISASHTIHVRNLPEKIVIAAKVGATWYALPANMSSESTPDGVQIEVNEATMTATAPNTCTYTIWPVKTTSGSGDRYALHEGNAYGERVRFAAINNSNNALWANNAQDGTSIRNWAAIASLSDGSSHASYEWKITTTIANGKWKHTLQTDQSINTRYLRYNGSNWGMYASGENNLYLLPVTEVEPFEMQVVEWYPTKVLVQTESDLTTLSPTVTIEGEEVASPTFTSKGTNLYEISGLALENNPTKMLTVQYTTMPTIYSCMKTIPIILSRAANSKSIVENSELTEPFATLTKEVYNYSDLVVRDGAVLTVNGTEAQNTFRDVTIYPTSKISVPAVNVNSATNKLSVHRLTFFGGIDEIYNGSTYAVNKYGVPELSLKGNLGKTVTNVDYLMRVDLDQMYRLAVPYDVSLNGITYWDGTAMTPGTDLYVSAYDGAARAARSGNTWVWETDFETKFGEAKLKAGVGYTVSAEPQNDGDTYSIIRMPMTSNVSSGGTEAAKTVAVTAHGAATEGLADNHKGWNFVGNPYMTSISGAPVSGATYADLTIGYLHETESGGWELVSDTYRYVTIPNNDGTGYSQSKWTETTLEPFKSFFVQVATNGALSFAIGSRADAPARNAQARDSEVEFEVILAGNSQKDHTGLLIADRYTPAYEINADLEKMENPLSVYTLTGGYKLAYNALSAENAKQPIPVGYIANTAGSFSFRLDENSNVSAVDHVWLTDYELDRVVDLLDAAYEFTTVKGRNETRFALSVELVSKTDVVTAIDNLPPDDSSGRPIKFIQNDKMYILNQGILYDATGKRVNRINK